MLSRQRLRQCQRLQSLYRAQAAFERRRLIEPHLPRPAGLDLAWRAILRAPGYQASFVSWLWTWPTVTAIPLTAPSSSYLHELSQLVAFDYRAVARQAAQVKKDTFRYKLLVDSKVGGSARTFAEARPRPFQLLQAV